MPSDFAALLLLIAACGHCSGSRLVYHNEDSQPNELDMMELFIGEPVRAPGMVKRSDLYEKDRDQKQASGLWFGPRLGRRRRSVGTQEARTKRSIDDTVPGKQTLYFGQDGPWTIMTFGGSKRESNFSPRLGRHLDDEMVLNFMEPMLGGLRQSHQEGVGQGSGPDNFSPRLGRLAPLPQH